MASHAGCRINSWISFLTCPHLLFWPIAASYEELRQEYGLTARHIGTAVEKVAAR